MRWTSETVYRCSMLKEHGCSYRIAPLPEEEGRVAGWCVYFTARNDSEMVGIGETLKHAQFLAEQHFEDWLGRV